MVAPEADLGHHDSGCLAPFEPRSRALDRQRARRPNSPVGGALLNRRTLDILVPSAYVLFVIVAMVIGDSGGVGGVATIGAFCVAAYFGALRQNIKA